MGHELPVVWGLECCVLQLQAEGNGGKQETGEVIRGGGGRKIWTHRGVARFSRASGRHWPAADPPVAECNLSDILQQKGDLRKAGKDKRSGVCTHFDHNMKEEKNIIIISHGF